ncbi:hypothetical protein H012_gp895 [Acanthamoeba polyphaga moumouvirus]|uniref:Ankyrin repeat protein n=2 Tax=Moumouvirus TaxID=3080801 RepID=L7RBQ8_9VIRU|nr:hypothetical protein H012_gp895 [Acanthamoeba polyphaga moumouvirus]AEX63306.1 hypothetical protein mv_L1104 [Moumouvirus Monve]AGC01571.1 hypothetical protein Moumou_00023 [Acanthamoeba polyphaga moumouvirus]
MDFRITINPKYSKYFKDKYLKKYKKSIYFFSPCLDKNKKIILSKKIEETGKLVLIIKSDDFPKVVKIIFANEKKPIIAKNICHLFYEKYLDFIVDNEMNYHLKIFIKYLLPFLKKYRNVWFDLQKYLLSYLECEEKNICLDSQKKIINCFDYNFICYALDNCVSFSDSIIKHILKNHKKCVMEIFSYENNQKYKNIKIKKISVYDILEYCILKNKPDKFKILYDYFTTLSEEISLDEINYSSPDYDKYRCLYESIQISDKIIKELFYYLSYHKYRNSILQHILLNNYNIELVIDFIYILLDRGDYDEYFEICLEWLFQKTKYDEEFINVLFVQAKKCSLKMLKILIEYGANYKKYGKRLIYHANVYGKPNIDLIKYIETLIQDNQN